MKYLFIISFSLLSLAIFSQTEIELRTDGIVVPRLETGAVISPSIGQVIYDTLTAQLMYYDGTDWSALSGAFERNGTTVRQNEGYDTEDFVFGREDLPPDTPITDTLFFFDQSKGVFRGGSIDGIQWREDSLGLFSFAYGIDVTASGSYSVSMGQTTSASGDFGATALGSSTIASGYYGATALGSSTIASGYYGATALGYFTEASGAWGATALGYLTEARGASGATALGRSTIASGDNGATALGSSTIASGASGATALGYFTEASGDDGATALGSSTIASGDDGATALGSSTIASGDGGATALGYRTIANGDNGTVVGRYNDTLVSAGMDITETSPLFIVGNGDPGVGNESNALVVLKNGEITASVNRLVLESGGDLGIGVSNPTYKLDVAGAINAKNGVTIGSILKANGAQAIWYNDTYFSWGFDREYNYFADEIKIGGGGVTAPDDALEVIGDIDATGCVQTDNSGSIGGTCLSDERLKENITLLESQIEKIRKLKPSRFEWKDPVINGGQSSDIGLIAQEVESVIPEMVKSDNDGMKKIRYDISLQMRMIKAFQELDHINQEQASEIVKLKDEVSELKSIVYSMIDKESE